MANSNDNSNDNTNQATQPNANAETSESAAPVKPQTLREATANATHAFGFRGAYLQLKPNYDGMPADKLPPVTLDVNKIIVLGMGVLPEVEKLRPVIQDECPRLPGDLIDQVRYALFGLAHANILKQVAAAGGPSEGAGDAAEPLRVVRAYLVSDVTPLVARRIVAPEAIALTQGNSPRNVAFDVLRLVEVADSNYHHLEGQSKTTRADLQAAAKAAQELLEQLGAREQASESAEDSTLTRMRALAYFVALYEELRWGVRFVRRHYKDAHTIMPSLFTLRKKRTTSAVAEDTEDELPADEPSAPTGSPEAAGIDLAHLQALMNGGAQPAAVNSAATNAAAPAASVALSGGVNPGGNGAR